MCGLRRAELVAEVTVESIVLRESRWVLADITGKGGRTRSVAVPGWVKRAIDDWVQAASIKSGPVFRAVRKGGQVWGPGLSPGAVLQIVREAAVEIGVDVLAPHDLRRTCAKAMPQTGRGTGDPVPAGSCLDRNDRALFWGASKDLVTVQ